MLRCVSRWLTIDYRDYIEIIRYEQLEESKAVREHLNHAKYWQGAIKRSRGYGNENNLAKKFEEEKIRWIMSALDIARFEKQLGYKIYEDSKELENFINSGEFFRR